MVPYKVHSEAGMVFVEFVDLGLSESPELDAMAARLQEELMRSQTKRMVIDCGRLQTMSSRGLGVIVALSKLAQHHKGALAVCGLRPQIAQLFKFSGTDRCVVITHTREEAVAALTNSPSI